ncbi:MAG TPA: hypothetical protein PLA03_00455 [Acidobacteriota bacterium]|nr:hypothetical protein [Acidobacteriota bacterium]
MSKEKKIAYFCPIHPNVELHTVPLQIHDSIPPETMFHCPECNIDHQKKDCVKLEYED